MRYILLLPLLAMIAGCGAGSQSSSGAGGSSSGSASDARPSAKSGPHNFQMKINGIYYYNSTESEKTFPYGPEKGDIVGYQYLGHNNDGMYAVALVDDRGSLIVKAYCPKDCAFVYFSDGQKRPFSKTSTIGEAFTDIYNDRLEIAAHKAS